MSKKIPSNIDTPASSQTLERTIGRQLRRMNSAELLGAAREIVIEHAGSEYRLRITSNDKLILTK